MDAARACLTIQAQDPPAAALALRARTSGLTAEHVRTQAAGGDVVRAWLMRNTIHLFAADDLAWMRPLLAERPLRPAMKRFEQLGMDQAAVEGKLDLLRERLSRGPLPRAEARELLISSGLEPGEGSSRIYWMIHVAALRGVLAVSPALDQKQTFVAPAPDEPLDRDEGYARLAAPLPRGLRSRDPTRLRLLGQDARSPTPDSAGRPQGIWSRSGPSAGRCRRSPNRSTPARCRWPGRTPAAGLGELPAGLRGPRARRAQAPRPPSGRRQARRHRRRALLRPLADRARA